MCQFCSHIYPSFDKYWDHCNELEDHAHDDENDTQGIHFNLVKAESGNICLSACSIVDYDALNQDDSIEVKYCPVCGRKF